MESLTFLYPTWYLLLCLLTGAGLAALLYYRDKTFAEQPLWIRLSMAFLRFLAITAISALLLQPMIRHEKTEVQQPYIAVLADNSKSVTAREDSARAVMLYEEARTLENKLEGEAQVDYILFGEEERLADGMADFSDRYTDLSAAFDYVYQNYAGLNLGAVILMTDGVYNRGRNPLYLNQLLQAPLYVVPLGDTSRTRDIGLRNVFFNDIVYLGDRLEIQADVEAFNFEGESSTVRLYEYKEEGRREVAAETISFDRNDFFETLSFIVEPDKAGVVRYRMAVSPLEEEENRRNNVRDIYLEVLDSRSTILLLADAPHPDLNAIKELLTLRGRKEVVIDYVDEYTENFQGFDLVILHQIPGRNSYGNLQLNKLQNAEVPLLFVLGRNSNIVTFNRVQDMLGINGSSGQINEAEAYINPEFTLFNLEESTVNFIPTLPPLLVPFGEFSLQGGVQSLLLQKIGDVRSGYPLFVLGEISGRKMGVLAGEGIWRWKLFNYLQEDNFEYIAGLLEKSIQYLSLKEDRRRFRVYLEKNIFDENESPVFRAELYNQSYEPVNEPDVQLAIFDEEGQEYNFTFDKDRNGYILDAGSFAEGNYSYAASVRYEGEEFRETGSFSVQPIQLELYRATADHNLLRLLAERQGGELIAPANLDRLEQLIRDSEALKPVYYSRSQNSSVLQIEWVLAILLFILGLEWFIRKYLGAY